MKLGRAFAAFVRFLANIAFVRASGEARARGGEGRTGVPSARRRARETLLKRRGTLMRIRWTTRIAMAIGVITMLAGIAAGGGSHAAGHLTGGAGMHLLDK